MSGNAGRPEAAPPPSTFTHPQFSTRVDMVQVTAIVFDGRRPVRGLPREAFRVFEDDVPRPLVHFAAEQAPLELFVAIDVSSSVRKVMGQIKENSARLLTSLPPTSSVTLVSFNDELQVLANRSAPPLACLQAIAPLAPFGMTSLYDLLVHSFDVLGQEIGRRGIVVLTDGEDTASRTPSEVVEQRAETSDAFVYVIGHGQALQSPELKELCERLADKSGGRAFFPRRPTQVQEAIDTVLEELSSQYLLVYQPRLKNPDDKWHRIRVEAVGGYDVRTRQGYRYSQ